jgi:hypothetical protein
LPPAAARDDDDDDALLKRRRLYTTMQSQMAASLAKDIRAAVDHEGDYLQNPWLALAGVCLLKRVK